MGPEHGKFLFVTTLDARDMKACEVEMKKIIKMYEAKRNTAFYFLNSHELLNNLPSEKRRPEDKDFFARLYECAFLLEKESTWDANTALARKLYQPTCPPSVIPANAGNQGNGEHVARLDSSRCRNDGYFTCQGSNQPCYYDDKLLCNKSGPPCENRLIQCQSDSPFLENVQRFYLCGDYEKSIFNDFSPRYQFFTVLINKVPPDLFVGNSLTSHETKMMKSVQDFLKRTA